MIIIAYAMIPQVAFSRFIGSHLRTPENLNPILCGQGKAGNGIHRQGAMIAEVAFRDS